MDQILTAQEVKDGIKGNSTKFTKYVLESPTFSNNAEGKPVVRVNAKQRFPFQLSRAGFDYLAYRMNLKDAAKVWELIDDSKFAEADAQVQDAFAKLTLPEPLIFATQNNVLYGVLTEYVPVLNTELVDLIVATFPESIVSTRWRPTRFDVFVATAAKSRTFAFRIMVTNGETGHVTLRYSSVAHHIASGTNIEYSEVDRKRARHLKAEGITELFAKIKSLLDDATYSVRFENAETELVDFETVRQIVRDAKPAAGIAAKMDAYLVKVMVIVAGAAQVKSDMITTLLTAATSKGETALAARISGLVLESVAVK